MADSGVEEVKFITGDGAPGELEANYKLGRVLGQGAFAKVKLATCTKDNVKWAVKVISRRSLSASDSESLKKEMSILQKVAHKNIVRTKEIYDTPNFTYIVMECMSGGELFDRIVDMGSYTELEAKTAFWDIMSAISYCHSHGVVHRDLKPENILYTSAAPDADLKLADFGLADVINSDQCFMPRGYTIHIAPEILRKEYGKEVDVWSAGVILYILICGFHHSTLMTMCHYSEI